MQYCVTVLLNRQYQVKLFFGYKIAWMLGGRTATSKNYVILLKR